jgi:integrative and conjugative element protein (TIGR02256 family)
MGLGWQKNIMTGNYEAWSEDTKFGLRIPSHILQKMLNLCREKESVECGGILVGYYNRKHDCAIVIDCSGPPKDSTRGKNFFHRGIHGLQKWIDKLWKLGHRRYYLGEWHFHPFGNPDPSDVDEKQIKENSENKSYHCPEPIMFIIGGDPNNNWSCRTLLYLKGKGLIELYK